MGQALDNLVSPRTVSDGATARALMTSMMMIITGPPGRRRAG